MERIARAILWVCPLRRLALVFIWLFFAPTTEQILQCQETPVAQRVTVPFTTAGGNIGVPLLLVEATINGKQATLILDSGAQNLTITLELASGLRPLGKVEHHGIGGNTESTVVAVQIRLGGVIFPYCLAETQDLRAVSSSLGVKIDGLIGESVLSQFKTVTIDYTNHTVYLYGTHGESTNHGKAVTDNCDRTVFSISNEDSPAVLGPTETGKITDFSVTKRFAPFSPSLND